MRSGDLTDASHLLPQPPKNPWNSSSLAWTSSYSGLMEFSAKQVADPFKSFQHQKRKSDYSPPLPTKQLITEDKMAAHLNSLHISNDFTAHNTNTSTEEPIPGTSTATDSMNTATPEYGYIYPINNTKELEEKLKRANRITFCDEIKNLQHDNNILPKALLNHYQKPCTALVIWQPPQKILGLVGSEQNDDSDDSDSETALTNDIVNNNVSCVDFNNYSMDTDL